MSQSEEHRRLVLVMADLIQTRFPNTETSVDLRLHRDDVVPPLICHYRPDIYARDRDSQFVTIAEAKTDHDLRRGHTYRQLSAFVTHLTRRGSGLFILAVEGHVAAHAKTMLRFLPGSRERRVRIAVYDGCDLWYLAGIGVKTWRLD